MQNLKREQSLIGKEMYQSCLGSSTINKTVNAIFISTVKLTSNSDVALNKCTGDNGSFSWLFSCIDCLKLMVIEDCNRTSNVFSGVNVNARNRNLGFSLTLQIRIT